MKYCEIAFDFNSDENDSYYFTCDYSVANLPHMENVNQMAVRVRHTKRTDQSAGR